LCRDQPLDDRDFRVAAREAQIAAAAVERLAIERLVERRPHPHGLTRERQFRGMPPGLAHAGKRPSRCHRRGEIAIEQRHAHAFNGDLRHNPQL
jgi:hypothetical protein